MGRFGINQSNQ